MTDQNIVELIIRERMHGLYLSRKCSDLITLAHELLGLHSWFYRNVCFSALIRGVDIYGWKTALTKTWLYRGTLHGVAYEDLPMLLALHPGDSYLNRFFNKELVDNITNSVLRYMEDGVYSRTEFRKIFLQEYDENIVEAMFSPWGGIFVELARKGKVAFRDMTSRDFDLISAEPAQSVDEVLPELLYRYFTVYGPATVADAAWFFGFIKDDVKKIRSLSADKLDLNNFELNGNTYYYNNNNDETADIPEITLLSGFDPLIVSYTDRSAVLPVEYKSRVVLKSGICNPTIAINGRIAGIWNIKKNEPVIEFFNSPPKRITSDVYEMVDLIRIKMK